MGYPSFLDLFILTSGKLCISIEPFLSDLNALPSLKRLFYELECVVPFVLVHGFVQQERPPNVLNLTQPQRASHDHGQRNQWNGGLNLAKVLMRTKSEGVSVE